MRVESDRQFTAVDFRRRLTRAMEGRMRRACAIPRLILVLAIVACAEDSPTVTELPTNNVRANLNTSGTPSQRPSWNERSADEVWDYIIQNDTTVIVGLTAPGKRRGVIDGEVALTRTEWSVARDVVRDLPFLVPLRQDTFLPAMLVKLQARQALDVLRNSGFVDYVEPARYHVPEGYSFWASWGCGDASAWSGSLEYLPSGDVLPWNYKYGQMQVADAWRRSQGSGVTIGLIDTGIDPTQPELNQNWASGSSTGRWHRKAYTQPGGEIFLPQWTDRCGHGTHMAGVIGAPMNGTGTVGVAYRANLITVRHHGDVWAGEFEDVFTTAAAIDTAAANHEARIIEMAFGSDEAFIIMEDKIRFWSNRGRLFIGAAGTSFCGNPFHGVLFPADLPDVVAVTATDPSGGIECGSHYGSEVELTAPTPTPTTANLINFDALVAKSGRSSNASALVAAVAALVWSKYPHMTREQVRERLHFAGGRYPQRHSAVGYGTVIAHKAVGGMYNVQAAGPGRIVTDENVFVTYYADPWGGDGPFTYQWHNGKTSSSITFEVPAPDPGDTDTYNVRLTVTDLSDGTMLTTTRTLFVEGCTPGKTCEA